MLLHIKTAGPCPPEAVQCSACAGPNDVANLLRCKWKAQVEHAVML